MKYSYLLILLIGLFCFQCNSDDNDLDANCFELQEDLDSATLQKVAALEAYTKDPDNGGVCANYVEALENRIEKIQAYLNSGCIENGPIYSNLEAAIAEHRTQSTN